MPLLPQITAIAPDYTIREADLADADVLIAFTIREAMEAEGCGLDAEDVRRGVESVLAKPLGAGCWVAECASGQVVASTSIVTEWSNFHGGYYWWIQSLFILPDHRRRGLAERLLEHVAKVAGEAGALDLRLYAHKSNQRALEAYRRCGFSVAPYTIMTKSLRRE